MYIVFLILHKNDVESHCRKREISSTDMDSFAESLAKPASSLIHFLLLVKWPYQVVG